MALGKGACHFEFPILDSTEQGRTFLDFVTLLFDVWVTIASFLMTNKMMEGSDENLRSFLPLQREWCSACGEKKNDVSAVRNIGTTGRPTITVQFSLFLGKTRGNLKRVYVVISTVLYILRKAWKLSTYQVPGIYSKLLPIKVMCVVVRTYSTHSRHCRWIPSQPS